MTDLDRFLKGLTQLQAQHSTCLLEVDWGTTTSVVGALQLALRHPDMPPLTRSTVRRFVDRLLDRIGDVQPEVSHHLRKGDDPTYDAHK